MNQVWQVYTVFAILATTLAIGLTIWFTSSKKKQKPKPIQRPRPEKWVLVGNVSKLIIYPVKSVQGVEVEEAVVTTLGLRFKDHSIRDRDFMVVNKNGKTKTMVQLPKMALINVEVGGNRSITLNAPGMDNITFSYPEHTVANEKLCRVQHDTKVKALDCGDEIAEWLQAYLGKDGLRLYYHHIQETQRTFEPYMYHCPLYELSDMGSFHNETSYLMVSQESIDDLNMRIDRQSSWKNWRPTILIDKVSEPFAEVNWSYVRIGSANGILKAAAPRTGCPITTVDQENGVVPRDGEPLRTLRKMNKADVIADPKVAELLKNKGIMGLRLGLYLPAGEGAVLKSGDPVYAALL